MRRGFASALVLPLIAVLATVDGAARANGQMSASSSTATANDPTAGATQASQAMQAYQAALTARRLGGNTPLGLDDVRSRLAEAETLRATGRTDEAIGRLYELVEDPHFSLFVQTQEGRGTLVALGDALADAGAYEAARVYLRRVIALPNAWDKDPTQARRAVRRLVEIALESDEMQNGFADLAPVPTTVHEETRGEVMYLEGRAYEAKGTESDRRAADLAYAAVTPRSRWWSQATYLRGLLAIEAGRLKDAEDLFCQVADPKRQGRTTPVFADERFFAVRDLARLALGRLAHEESRFDDARYYYYLVPADSDRLAEALYEAATSRYEKKDYDGASELLDDLAHVSTTSTGASGNGHHAYEDEAMILRAYVELGRCHFADADRLLRTFIQTYEPVRDSARRLLGSDALLRNFAREAGNDTSALAAAVKLDRQFASLLRRRAILEHEAGGLEVARLSTRSMRAAIGTPGAVQPSLASDTNAGHSREEAERALVGLERAIADAEAAGGQGQVADAKQAALKIEASLGNASSATGASAVSAGASDASSADLGVLLQRDDAEAGALLGTIGQNRQALEARELTLGREAVSRVDLRLSRLLRRARLGRIESVLGRKRALEIEVEAIQAGMLPQGALDSLDAARYLEDDEEYWPYEGDDWPDEYVGGEGLR